MPGGLADSWHRCSRSHRDSDASTSWGHISAPSRPLVLVLGFPSFRCSLKFRSCYWLLSSSSMVGYSEDTAQFHRNLKSGGLYHPVYVQWLWRGACSTAGAAGDHVVSPFAATC